MDVLAIATLLVSITISVAFVWISGIIFVMIKTGVPFASTPYRHLTTILDQLRITNGSIFYDLGCGDGRLLIAAAQRGARATGFELSPWAYCKARFAIWRKKSSATVRRANFYTTPLHDADAIFCFLLRPVMPRVTKK